MATDMKTGATMAMRTDVGSSGGSKGGAGDGVVVFRGEEPMETAALGERAIIGRGAGADIQLEDASVSRVHALLQREAGRLQLMDLNSLNGTRLNGRKIPSMTPTPVADGDIAQLGAYALRFQLAFPAGDAVPPATRKEAETASTTRPAVDAAPPPASPLLEGLVAGRRELPLWTRGDIQLKVADIIDETEAVKTFRLVGITPILFSFKPGQFVTLKVNVDGREARRSYSISSSPSRPHCLEITIKRTSQGLVSNWMHNHVKMGDVLSLHGPSGRFSCFDYPSRKILFISAGSGITPVMSMLRWIVDTAADVDARLLDSARSPREIIFRNELNWMSSRHSGIRVGITCTSFVTGADAWTGLTGRCDAKMLQLFAPDILERHIFMCGPGPFMEAIKQHLKAMGFPLANLHTESFGEGRVAGDGKSVTGEASKTAAPAESAASAVEVEGIPATTVIDRTPTEAVTESIPAVAPVETAPVEAPKTAGFQVSFARSGKTVSTPGDTTLLELAEANGIEIDYACRSGVCGTCKSRLIKGGVEMDENGLSEEEKAAGFIYPCVAHPVSDIEIEA